jgi:hypothetical protein
MTLPRKFLRLSCGEKRRFLEAALWLGIFRAAILFVPFKALGGRLGKHMAETAATPLDAATRQETTAVSRAVQTMGRHLPWVCSCLVQAAAGKRMLDRRRIPGTLYLGAAQDDNRKLIAHAWLRAGDMIVTGGAAKDRFTVVSTFA